MKYLGLSKVVVLSVIVVQQKIVRVTFVVVLSLMVMAWVLAIRSLFSQSFTKFNPSMLTGTNMSGFRLVTLLDTEGCVVKAYDAVLGSELSRTPLCALTPPIVLANDTALWLRSPQGDKCCFHTLGDGYNSFKFDKRCVYIPAEGYKVLNEKRIGPDFGRVTCKPSGETSYHAFVPLHDDLTHAKKVNVLILGFSGLSATSLPRLLPRTWSFFSKNLYSVHMKGYSKVHDESFPCICTALTGLDAEAFRSRCLSYRSSTSPRDSCPWAWLFFAKNGYRTMLTEDWPHSMFNIGAAVTPQYWTNPLYSATYQDSGSPEFVGARECVGPVSQTQFLASYLTNFGLSFASANSPYFAVVWSHALKTDTSTAGHVDKAFADALRRLLDAGALRATALVLTSEPNHGEMPALLVAGPEWMRIKNPKKAERLESNGGRLITPRDLYVTFADAIKFPLVSFQDFRGYEAVNGVSLLALISPLRTCEDAGIDRDVCLCHGQSSS